MLEERYGGERGMCCWCPLLERIVTMLWEECDAAG